jgi:hypothetical protein
MTSAGANTWSVPLELNNLESVVSSSSGNGVTSISAGGGISVNASTGAVMVNNTGIISITPTGAIGISGTQNLTIQNLGVIKLTAGSKNYIYSILFYKYNFKNVFRC